MASDQSHVSRSAGDFTVSDIREIRRDMQDTSRNVDTLTKSVESVLRIIRDGADGQQPLLLRVALIERAVGDMTSKMGDVSRALDSRATEETKGRWGLVSVILTGLIALISATVSALILLKK